MQLFENLTLLDFQFATQQFLGVVDRAAQHIAHGKELGLALVNHAAVGRNVDLAVGKGIERIDGLVG